MSTKSIMDENNRCKGYGFVDFEDSASAERALRELQKKGIPAQMAKKQEPDPTNLYFQNIPHTWAEAELSKFCSAFGIVLSCRYVSPIKKDF